MNERGLDEEQTLIDSVGARQEVEKLDAQPTSMDVYREVPAVEADPTYYERPIIKEPVWIWAVPTYFYLGGLGGAAGVMAAAVELFGSGERQHVAKKLRQVALGGTVAGSGFLIADLGRPERFLNMLRVLRITSPMSVGSWVLAANGASLSVAVGADLVGGRLAATVSRLASVASALLGSVQCSYPAVLLSCTAVPVWQQSRYSLPLVFVGSAMSSLGSLADLAGVEEPAVQRFSRAGKVLELTAALALEKEVRQTASRVARPLREGRSGALWQASLLLTGVSLTLSLFGKSKWSRRLPESVGLQAPSLCASPAWKQESPRHPTLGRASIANVPTGESNSYPQESLRRYLSREKKYRASAQSSCRRHSNSLDPDGPRLAPVNRSKCNSSVTSASNTQL